MIGHSEGGIIAPMVAGKNPAIGFIVLMAGTGIPGGQLLLLQQQLVGKDAGVSDAELQKNKVVNNGAFDIIERTVSTGRLIVVIQSLRFFFC